MAAEARFPPIDADLLVNRAADLTLVSSLDSAASPTSGHWTFATDTGGASPQRSVHGGPAPSTATAALVDAQPKPADPVIAIQEYPYDLSRHCRSTMSSAASSIDTTAPADSVHPASPLGSPLPSTREPLSASPILQPSLGTIVTLSAARHLPPSSSGIMHRGAPPSSLSQHDPRPVNLDVIPNELLTHILGFLDVSDLLATSRLNHHFRDLSLLPILHTRRLRHARAVLPPLLTSPSRPTLADLIARHIFLTHTTQISRRLARNLVAIRLARRLPMRPSAETLAQRGVLPHECVLAPKGSLAATSLSPTSDMGDARPRSSSPSVSAAPGGKGTGGIVVVAPSLVATRRAVEKERIKDGLRRWVAGTWRGCVRERGEGVKQMEEKAGIGRVWRLRRFWERVSREG